MQSCEMHLLVKRRTLGKRANSADKGSNILF